MKLAAGDLGIADKIKIYSADVSTPDIQEITEDGSPWVATVATNPAVVGAVSIRAAALEVAGQTVPHQITVKPTLLTQESLRAAGVKTIEDARAFAWVMEPLGTASRHFAEQTCRLAGFEPDVRYETADLQAQMRLVESGNAVALMPDLVWTGREPDCRLIALPSRPRRTIFIAQRDSGRQSPAAAAFLSMLADAAADQLGRSAN